MQISTKIYDAGDDLEAFVSKQLNHDQYDALIILFNQMLKGELKTSKERLYRYFAQLIERDFKDYAGKPIKDLVRYVQRNIALNCKSEYKNNYAENII